MNGSSCSLIKFLNQTVEGNTLQNFPKWAGTNFLISMLNNFQETLDHVDSQYNDVYGDTDSYYIKLSNEIENIDNLTFELRNYFEEYSLITQDEWIPSYISEFTISDKSSLLGDIIDKFQSKILYSYFYLSDLKEPLSNVYQSKKDIKIALETLSSNFSNINDVINNTSNVIANHFLNFNDKLYNLYHGFEIYMIIFFLISFSLIGILFVYASLNIKILTYVIFVFWNILFLLTSCGMVVSSFLGIFSRIEKETSLSLEFLLSDSYLEMSESILGGNKNTGKYLDICYNGNGDLINSFLSDIQKINSLYISTRLLDDMDSVMSSIDNSFEIEKNFNKSNKIIHDKSEIINRENHSLKELSKLNITKEKEICNSQIVDNDICFCENYHNPEFPTKGYDNSELKPQDINNMEGIEFICVINNCSLCDCNKTNSGLTCIGEINLDSCDYCYFNNNVNSDFEFLFSQDGDENKKGILNNLDTEISKAIKNLHDMINSFKTIVNPINNSLTILLTDKSNFKEIFNCSMLKQDIIEWSDQYSHLLSSSTSKLCTSTAICSFSCFVSLVFVILSLNKLYPSPEPEKKEEKVEKEKKSNSNKMIELEELNNEHKIDAPSEIINLDEHAGK